MELKLEQLKILQKCFEELELKISPHGLDEINVSDILEWAVSRLEMQ